MPNTHDSEALSVILNLATARYSDLLAQIAPNNVGVLEPMWSAIETATKMRDRLLEAEKSSDALFQIACDVLSDHGYKPMGVRKTDDPPGLVQSIMSLSSDHLDTASRKWLSESPWAEGENVVLSFTCAANGVYAFLVELPETGADLPEDTPDTLMAVFNVALFRRVRYLRMDNLSPKFPDLPIF